MSVNQHINQTGKNRTSFQKELLRLQMETTISVYLVKYAKAVP